ncbi:LysR family transcriptional regulator [Roseibaca sp. V10]|uniref:LysR family transcriptional regulator n=1 Tax=Roseinatronobacter domitianus TaxID=2940293 RepID=A0ABT0LZW7_9RHOB|nr:LysR family transcriptional regulator [Roseibaca domitiana]MCL1628158.1 LysR family transcriptional regulator [Roseibaca domitiana]
MSLEPWDELRTALQVARAGTVSGAAQRLGVHHATVIRHIDGLEDRLGVKLFQRHAKGYALTEAGRMLTDGAAEAEARFDKLAARLDMLQSGIEGDLCVTTVPELCDIVLPVLSQLRADNPQLVPCLRVEERLARLEYGEAHLALRAGARPTEPDNVVQPLGALPVALFAAPAYLERRGMPRTEADLADHDVVTVEPGHARAPFDRWMEQHARHVGLHSNDRTTLLAAMRAGLGLGFAPASLQSDALVQVMPPRPDWSAELWLVTHVDLHRSPKVQAATTALKARFAALADESL